MIGIESSQRRQRRSEGNLYCYHVSSRSDVNLRKRERGRESERTREMQWRNRRD